MPELPASNTLALLRGTMSIVMGSSHTSATNSLLAAGAPPRTMSSLKTPPPRGGPAYSPRPPLACREGPCPPRPLPPGPPGSGRPPPPAFVDARRHFLFDDSFLQIRILGLGLRIHLPIEGQLELVESERVAFRVFRRDADEDLLLLHHELVLLGRGVARVLHLLVGDVDDIARAEDVRVRALGAQPGVLRVIVDRLPIAEPVLVGDLRQEVSLLHRIRLAHVPLACARPVSSRPHAGWGR